MFLHSIYTLSITFDNILFSLESQDSFLPSLLIFLVIAVIISTLGLYFLDLFSTHKRPFKEIAIISVTSTFGSFLILVLSVFSTNFTRFPIAIIVGLFFFLLLIGAQKKLLTFFIKSKNHRPIDNLMLSLVSIIFSVAGLIITFFTLYSYNHPCIRILYRHTSAFNQHIKDLCYLRENTAECPTSEDELKAFEPTKYQELQYCASTKYYFDDETENYKWRVEPFIKRSAARTFPEFSTPEEIYLKERE